jgi:hypothetical protein
MRVKTDLTSYVSGRANVGQPTCGDEAAATANDVTVTSDGGDSVKWCFGEENGQNVLKIANNRRTFTDINYPGSWTVLNGGSRSLSAATVARALGTAYSAGRGRASRIVDGGDTLTVAVPQGADGRVHADMSIESWYVSILSLGVDVYGGVAKGLDTAIGRASTGLGSRLINALSGATDTEVTSALRTCARGLGDLTDDPVDSSAFASTMKFAFGCAPEVARAELRPGRGLVAATALTIVGSVVDAVLTAANLLVTGLRQIYDNIASFAGSSDPSYDIDVRAAASSSTSPTPTESSSTTLGTVVVHGQGDSLDETYSVGALRVGLRNGPPSAVIAACGDTVNSGDAEQSVYLPGTLRLTYHGRIPESVSVWMPALPEFVGGDEPNLWASAVQLGDGTWVCGPDGGGPEANLTDGQSMLVNFWVIDADVVTNAEPTLSSAARKTWVFGPAGLIGDEPNDPRVTAIGPNAVLCDAQYVNLSEVGLAVFARPPFSVTSADGTRHRCTPFG